jgi:hypothetical protein
LVSLIRKLSESAELPAYLRRLSARQVLRVIDEVGFDDSREIVAALNADQFRDVMAHALWSRQSNGNETLDPYEFLRWLALWQQDGDAMVCRRVLELDEDLVVACFRNLIDVADRTERIPPADGLDIGTFVVTARSREAWPRLTEALTSLWGGDPDFLLRILRRCDVQVDRLNSDHAQDCDALLEDLAAERLTAWAKVGHVNGLDATMFLMAARTADIDALCTTTAYDITTAHYLDMAARLAASPCEAWTDEHHESTLHKAEFAVLDKALRENGIVEVDPSIPLLEGARVPENIEPDCGYARLEHAIGRLAERSPEIASVRMQELGYLANVLFAAAQSHGRPLTEHAAARLAVSTASLGASHLMQRFADGGNNSHQHLEEMLSSAPGVVRLFQVGFHLVSLVPVACSKAVYSAKDAQSRRRGHVAYLEMEALLGSSHLTDLVQEGRYGEAKSVIDGLVSVMDGASCTALRILIDPLPAFPLLLSGRASVHATYVDRRTRPIDCIQDLDRIYDFLSSVSQAGQS